MRSHRRRSNFFAIVLFTGLVFALFGRSILRREILFDGDVASFYFPVKTAIRRMMVAGHSLLWNPLWGEGQPLAANPEHEIYYPFTWLLRVVPVAPAIWLTLLAHLAIGYAGMLRFLRRIRCSETAAIFGAAAWAFGGLSISSLHVYPMIFAAAWLPWLADGCVRLRRWRDLPRAALPAALILAVGEPVSVLISALAVAALLPAFPPERRRLPRLAAAAALAALVAAAPLLPGIDLARRSPRARGLTSEKSDLMSFPLLRAAELAVPRTAGSVASGRDDLYPGWRLVPDRGWPFYYGIYGGALLLPLALAGFLSRGRRLGAAAMLAVLSLAIAAGPMLPIWPLLRRSVPLWRTIRIPEKFLTLTIFLLVVAASAGFDGVRRRRRERLTFLTVEGSLLALIVTNALEPDIWTRAFRLACYSTAGLDIPRLAAGFRAAFGGALIRHAALVAALAGLIVVRRRHRAGACILFLVVAAVDLDSASSDFIFSKPIADAEREPPAITRLLRSSPPPRLADFLPRRPAASVPESMSFMSAYSRNRLSGYTAVQWGVPLAANTDYDLTEIEASSRVQLLLSNFVVRDRGLFAKLLAARGIGALLVWKEPVTATDPVTPVGVPGVRPEVDSVTAVLPFRGDAGFLAVARGFSGDLTRAAFVEEPVDWPDRPAAATIHDLSISNDRVTFDSESPSTAIVRIARTNDGHWRARIDGRPAVFHTVDISLLGLGVPPGRHRVEVRYSNPLIAAGLAISALALGGTVIAAAATRYASS